MDQLTKETIYDSEEKLATYLNKYKDEHTAIINYIENVKYPSIEDFKPGLEWFNTSQPLSLVKHLKGKVVLLDFFTYCCINCMHVLPDLSALEQEFTIEDGLVVIGVHSAKFANEKQSTNILAAVQRYAIKHPVVNDCNMDIWNSCNIMCWPTLLLLSPEGKPLLISMGEGNIKLIRTFITTALAYYKSEDQISDHSLPIKSAFHLLPIEKGPLLFPGKITVRNKNGDLLAVSDTGNNRILIIQDGKIIEQIGDGRPSFKDGHFESCSFNQPQGLVFRDSDTIYVADTENHAIRKVNLLAKTVETIAGNGRSSEDKMGGHQGRLQGLSSPWDLQMYKHPTTENSSVDVLLIAMAGGHQIWALFLSDTLWRESQPIGGGTVLPIAGSGAEENRNQRDPKRAAFAQPSGLALAALRGTPTLFVADSESSSVRKVELIDGPVTAVVGGDINPQNLFAFGDKDGVGTAAKLQHPLGLTLSSDEKALYVADTYNHKIKIVDVETNTAKTMVIVGKDANLNEPGGLCFSPTKNAIYVADTNNHQLKIIDLESLEAKVIRLEAANHSTPKNTSIIGSKALKLAKTGFKVILTVTLTFTDDLKLAIGAPQTWRMRTPNVVWSCVPIGGEAVAPANRVEVVICAPNSNVAKDNFEVCFDLVTCTDDACFPKRFAVDFEVIYSDDGDKNVTEDVIIKIGTDNIKIL